MTSLRGKKTLRNRKIGEEKKSRERMKKKNANNN
jgi:hypothetical protein